jgi:hypothetical protein
MTQTKAANTLAKQRATLARRGKQFLDVQAGDQIGPRARTLVKARVDLPVGGDSVARGYRAHSGAFS